MSSRIMKSCAVLSILLMLLCSFGPLCSITGAAKTRALQPMASSPSGSGPYTISYIDDTITFSTKSYTTTIRIYYPANSTSVNAGVNRSKAPYPCIDWFPGTGGDHTSYGSYLTQMASWGFLVAAWDVNINDFPNNGNASDLNEFLDHLELRNVTGGDRLVGMIDKQAFGLAGHSMGGGMTFADGSQVSRIKVACTFSAAMSDGVVDAYGGGWSNKKILMQVGATDSAYKEPSEYAKNKLTGIHNFVEVAGAGHQVWQNVPYLFHAFMLYWLAKQPQYFEFIYGIDTVNDFVAGVYDLLFLYNSTYFFPPKVDNATASKTTVNMDSRVDFNANLSGYNPTGAASCQYQWDFDGDGTFDYSSPNGPAANHTYTAPKTYNVVFQYAFGSVLLITPSAPLTVVVNNVLPVAVVGPNITVNMDTAVLFDGSQSYDTPSDIAKLQYQWTFGDNAKTSYATSPNATHTYTKPGVFKVVLSVMDVHSGIGIANLKVNVTNVLPTASVGQNITVNEDQSLTLTGKGTDTASDSAGLQYKWDLGDGNSTAWSTTTDYDATYQQSGNYTATFHVKDVHGAEATASFVVHVNNVAPVAMISAPADGDSNVEDDTVTFSGIGTDTPSDTILGLGYLWDFGDGTTSGWSKVPSATHVYTKDGDFKIKFTVKDDDGASDFTQVTITITNPAPVVIIGTELKKAPNEDENVPFQGSATDTISDMSSLKYKWDFGDGANATGPAANHSYAQAKTYTVTLSVTDDEGAIGMDTVQMTVQNVRPVANASANRTTVKVGQPVSFSSTGSTDTKSDIATLQFSWSFGDGATSTNQSPAHAYLTAGTRTVTLTVTDNDGATATQTLTITVQPATSGGGGGNKGKASGNSLLVPLLVALVVIIIVVLLLVMLLRKKKPAKGKASKKEIPKEPEEHTEYPDEPKKTPKAPPVTEKKTEKPKDEKSEKGEEQKKP